MCFCFFCFCFSRVSSIFLGGLFFALSQAKPGIPALESMATRWPYVRPARVLPVLLFFTRPRRNYSRPSGINPKPTSPHAKWRKNTGPTAMPIAMRALVRWSGRWHWRTTRRRIRGWCRHNSALNRTTLPGSRADDAARDCRFRRRALRQWSARRRRAIRRCRRGAARRCWQWPTRR